MSARLALLLPFAHALSATTPWKSYLAYNADVGWRGYATLIDPRTAVPTLPGVTYSHFVASDEDERAAAVRTTTSVGAAGPDKKLEETVAYVGGNADIDLDGSYSCEHPDGLALATLLLNSAEESKKTPAETHRVIEHSLAVSDEERRRCLLSYSTTTGALDSVLLLVEKKGEAADVAAQSTLYSLVGTWRGDACVRSPTAAATSKAPRGFGKDRGGGGGFGGGGKQKDSSAPDSLGAFRTAVFKARLTYAWDGDTSVARQLCVTSSFGGGGDLDAIRSSGTLLREEGDYGEYESVRFVGDATLPTLLLLPAACHLLAPLQLPVASAGGGDLPDGPVPFSTEFGAVLEPGESFGWRGYQPSDDIGVQLEEGEEELPPLDPEGDASAPRLVRSSRLYSAVGKLVSCTTSFCEAE